jgi:hypothetical protein
VRVGTELAQIHVDLPSREIEELLDTNPDRAQQGMRQDAEEVPA